MPETLISMIKTSDLRLGNWLNFKGENKRVTSVDEEHLNLNSEDFENSQGKYEQVWHSYDDSIEPIPLTPEILLKAGFKGRIPDSEQVLSWRNGNKVILNCYKTEPNKYFVYPALWEPTLKIEFIHQLQNLIYSLTGVELEIKL